MRGIFLFLFVCVFVSCACAGEPRDSLLKELDRTLKEKDRFDEQKEQVIATQKELLKHSLSGEQKFGVYGKLFDEYLPYATDSALYYAYRRLDVARELGNAEYVDYAEMNVANVMNSMGMYKEALDILGNISPAGLSEKSLTYYFHLYRTVYGAMADYSVIPEEKENYNLLTDRYRDSLLKMYVPGSRGYVIVKADQLIVHGECREALELLLKDMPGVEPGSHDMAIMAYSVAEAYRCLGNPEEEERYLILSSLSDIQSAVKEYVSLRRLSDVLYRKGDIDRAYDYLEYSLEDAIMSNARLRTFEISQIFPLINKAWQQKEEKQKEQMIILLVCISVLSFFLIVAVAYVYRQMKRLSVARREISGVNNQLKELNLELSASNARLKELNQGLSESSRIKEEYIGRYMDLCSVYIDKMDNYRRMLNRSATAGKTEELYREIKSTRFIEDELKEFYNNFDEAFLQLFPDFVEKINALLKEDGQLLPKPGEKLNTELRMYALIRLGVGDSAKIARFLRYSVTTIYNYRSKTKSKARENRDEFEEKVMKIGIV